jgi:hypothetical protein
MKETETAFWDLANIERWVAKLGIWGEKRRWVDE